MWFGRAVYGGSRMHGSGGEGSAAMRSPYPTRAIFDLVLYHPRVACGAGSPILPRRSRPRQAHAARRSFERRRIRRAVLTRRGGDAHPAPHHQLTLRRPPDANALHRPDRNPAFCSLPPRRSATICAPLRIRATLRGLPAAHNRCRSLDHRIMLYRTQCRHIQRPAQTGISAVADAWSSTDAAP